MEKIKVTIEIPIERLGSLQDFLTVTKSEVKKTEPVPVPEEPAVVAEKPKKPAKTSNEVDKAAVRARAVELTKAGKTADLEAIFKEVGADKLSQVKEEDYEKVYTKMGELL